MVEFSIFAPSDEDDVLRLIERSISTNRSQETWRGNPMTAVLAREGGKLIGALPMEIRDFVVSPKTTRKVGWVSAAHIDEGFRSKGVGSQLDRKAREAFSGVLDGFMVYREDETSAAYRWYERQGYVPLMPIMAFRKDVASTKLPDIETWTEVSGASEIAALDGRLLDCFTKCHPDHGGFPARSAGFWRRNASVHYYRDMNRYSVLAIHSGKCIRSSSQIDAFAVLARTAVRDGIDRFEILEFSAPDDLTSMKLLQAVEAAVKRSDLRELRIQFAGSDRLKKLFLKTGFKSRQHRTNIMASPIDPKRLSSEILEEQPIGLTISTPKLGAWKIGQNPCSENMSIELSDEALVRLLWRRLDFPSAVHDGRVACIDGSTSSIAKLAKAVSPSVWRYFQLDYI